MSEISELSRENLRILLSAFIEQNDLTVRKVAKAITCSEETLNRIIGGISAPTDEMIKQSGILFAIGFDKYSKLSKAEKEKISEKIGAIGGGSLGFGSISAVVGTLGTGGLSAAGIVSGLAALGKIVGGGMVAGIGVAAAIPIVAGAAGYGVIKGVKAVVGKYKTDSVKIDPAWELPIDQKEENSS